MDPIITKYDDIGQGDITVTLSNSNGVFAPNTIDRHSHVMISACELDQPSGEPLDFPTLGSGSIEIQQVAPRDDNKVDVKLSINTPNRVAYRLNIVAFQSQA